MWFSDLVLIDNGPLADSLVLLLTPQGTPQGTKTKKVADSSKKYQIKNHHF